MTFESLPYHAALFMKNNRRTYEQPYVRALFDSIAPQYDFLNHVLSSGVDILWRKKAIRMLQSKCPKDILDVATGTADFAIEAMCLHPDRIIGIDISSKMLEAGREKIRSRQLEGTIVLESGEAEHLRFEPESFDVVMAAFGVRNFENLELGLREFHRVLRKKGTALILELSQPRLFPVKQLYRFYSTHLLPWLGGIVSRNRKAYEYLPSTVSEFPDGNKFCSLLCSAGFTSAVWYPQTFGIATIYLATKEL